MEIIKEFIDITVLKHKKPIINNLKEYTVGDKGIGFKIYLSYDYNIDNLFGKKFQIQYLLPENKLLVDEFTINSPGLIIERRIDDRCFFNSGNIKIKFALKDNNSNVYLQFPFDIDIVINQGLYKSDYLLQPTQELLIDNVLNNTINKVNYYIDNNLDKHIEDKIDLIISNKTKNIFTKDEFLNYDNNINNTIENKINNYIEKETNLNNNIIEIINENINNKITDIINNKLSNDINNIINNNIDKILKNINIKDILNIDDIKKIINDYNEFNINNYITKCNFDENTFDIKNNKIYLKNNNLKNYFIYKDIIIYNIDILNKDDYNVDIYNYKLELDNNKLICYNIDTKREDDISKDLYFYALDYEKRKQYNIMMDNINEILKDYMLFYCFGIGDIKNIKQDDIKEKYYKNINIINNYNDLNKELKLIKLK